MALPTKEGSMKDGDLVELFQPGGEAAELMGCTGELSVGSMDDSRPRGWYRPVGTLAVHLGRHPRMPGEPAIVVLIDGKLGWVWDYEIRPATRATAPA
jgi:hypothetical protein